MPITSIATGKDKFGEIFVFGRLDTQYAGVGIGLVRQLGDWPPQLWSWQLVYDGSDFNWPNKAI